MFKFMLDTNVFSSICNDDTFLKGLEILVRKNRIELLTTHIQIGEINQIPKNDSKKKDKILDFIANYCIVIPTRNFVLGISILGQARLGGTQTLEAIRKGKRKMTKDALIAATAEYDADFLVTSDKELQKRADKTIPKIATLSYLEFYKAVFWL